MCFTRASGTVYTAIDIATGQEVGHVVLMKQRFQTLWVIYLSFAKPWSSLLFSVTHSSLLFSGGHQANEPAAAAQERADHQRDLGDEGKQKLQHSQLPGQVSFCHMHTKTCLWLHESFFIALGDIFKLLFLRERHISEAGFAPEHVGNKGNNLSLKGH